jgi:perosamine synthetase
MIPIMKPNLEGNELKYVSDCVETKWISSQGYYVTKFEQLVGDYIGSPYSLAVSNGTVALHLALVSLGIGKGDEVIVPDMTFAASVNAIMHAGATPVLVDVDEKTFNISIKEIEKAINGKTKAIMPVHLYGNPCDMDSINKLAKVHNLKVIEDAAEAFGSVYKRKKVGSLSDASTFSFFGNKTITTGEGGIIIFKDKEVYERASILRDHGMKKDRRYWHEYLGFNYRMTNLQAAVGVAQMERVENIIEKKISLANYYIERFKVINEIKIPKTDSENSLNTFWLFTFLLNKKISREKFRNYLTDKGIETRPTFNCVHEMPPYIGYGNGDFSISKLISQTGLSLPSFIDLKHTDLEYISDQVVKFFLK